MRLLIATVALMLASAATSAQPAVSTRVAIAAAEARRAANPRDLAIIRGGLTHPDSDVVRMAVRALGRLERPALVPEIAPFLRSIVPEVRAEAANALAQALHGGPAPDPKRSATRRIAAQASSEAAVASVLATLTNRLGVEADPSVRQAICESIGRLPYHDADSVRRAEQTLTAQIERDRSVPGRLGVAKGLDALLGAQHELAAPSDELVAALRSLAVPGAREARAAAERDARVRRLAVEALVSASAVGDALATRAAADVDPQVRRLAMRAAGSMKSTAMLEVLTRGLRDTAAMVRLEALAGLRARGGDEACRAALTAADDGDAHIRLAAIDGLAVCPPSAGVLARLEVALDDLPAASGGRTWHAASHAIVTLASLSPSRARELLPRLVRSPISPVRLYAARAATVLDDAATLTVLARDPDDNVVETAIDGLAKMAGTAADPVYVSALGRRGYQVVRAAARALGTQGPHAAAARPALEAALDRLNAEGHDNSRDARLALVDALQTFGVTGEVARRRADAASADIHADDLRRLASARARFIVRDLGTVDVALFTQEAPLTVTRFVQLAESGYYNGLTIHRVVPNFIVQGGSPGGNEFVGDAELMPDELGLWPHVRGAVGLSTRGRDTGDAQFFIDLVDNPRLDHEYTVFGQVLNGLDVVDRILEGDVIERVEILTQ